MRFPSALNRFIMALALSLLSAGQAQNSPIQALPSGKKLIEYGWDMPTPGQLQQAQAQLAASPFDGLTIKLTDGQLIFRKQALDAGRVAQEVKILKGIKSGKLRNSYLNVLAGAGPGWDWLSDQDWAQTERSAALIAGAARAAGLRGVMFDVEPYLLNPWDYRQQPGANTLSFAQMETRVRARGAAMMRAMQREYPKLEFYALFLLSANQYDLEGPPAELRQRLEGSTYGLWPAFVNGMLQAAGPGVRFVEGNEPAYYYLHADEFEHSRKEVRQAALPLIAAENRARYAAQVGMGQAVFADGVLNLWKSPRSCGYYFASDAERQQTLSHNIVQALRNTDEVAWFYNENANWWGKPKPGQERMQAAIELARQQFGAGKTVAPVANLKQAEAACNAKVRVGGDLEASGPVSFEISGVAYPEGQNPFCGTWNAGRRYSCTFPGNWTGSVRPLVDGKAVLEPPQRQYNNLKRDDWEAHFKLGK
ncbi:hypothetical protein [Deinococcus sp.]|uniref:hypothetical protein n=1 Tax=Deinococcus sp. TaxID=47478 RepID=UPI003B5C9B44